MRRKDREVTDPLEMQAFLEQEQILRVAFYDDGEVYIVPVNYGYVRQPEGECFYFHGAKAGRKYRLAQAAPRVGFEIDGKYELIGGEMACDYTAAFQSVIGTGRLRLVEDVSEKITGLNAIMAQTTGRTAWTYQDEMLEAAAIFRLDVETRSCKRKG